MYQLLFQIMLKFIFLMLMYIYILLIHTLVPPYDSLEFKTIRYERVSKRFRNHPKVKEPETSFLYSIHETSLKSHYAKIHIPPTFY